MNIALLREYAPFYVSLIVTAIVQVDPIIRTAVRLK